MHLLGEYAGYWWVLVLAIVGFIGAFVLVAGRGAEGGFKDRAGAGWKRWRELADRVANVQARILLTVFYFSIMVPIGLWQAFVSDRLRIRRAPSQTFWVERKTTDTTLDDVRRQY
ncbi:MAG: hypothetical protein U0821_05285 [Chloroflexota bacterium]